MSIDEEMRRLLDETAIKAVDLRYCRGIDRMDWDVVRSCYHPDGIDDHGEFVGGIEEFIQYGMANLPSFLSTAHHVTNQIVAVNGDTAHAEHYGIAYHRLPAGRTALNAIGSPASATSTAWNAAMVNGEFCVGAASWTRIASMQ